MKPKPKNSRPEWDEYWMNVAEQISKRSTCMRHNIGAVVVSDNIIVSTGFNGAPRGLPHCSEIGCIRDKLKIPSGERIETCRGVHAEENAIIRGNPLKMEGATLYVNAKPCRWCSKAIINAGIKRVVYMDYYPEEEGVKMLKEAGIELTVFNRK